MHNAQISTTKKICQELPNDFRKRKEFRYKDSRITLMLTGHDDKKKDERLYKVVCQKEI